MDIDQERARKIARKNDLFRQTGTHDINVTSGVYDLPDLYGLVQSVRQFDSFTEDNDPYSEHDFGSLDWHGETVYWKIDYYDQALRNGKDPRDVDCRRVLTVLLASEY